MRSEVSVLSGGVGLHLEARALTGPQREEAGTTQDGEVREDVGLERLRTKGTPAVVVAPPNANAFDDLYDRNVPRRGVRQRMAARTCSLMASDISRSEVRPTDPARLERAATLAMLRAGRTLTG